MTELRLAAKDILPADGPGLLVGRVWSSERGGPCPVVLDGEQLRDLSGVSPTMSGLLELPADAIAGAKGLPSLGRLDEFLDLGSDKGSKGQLLAPCDLQAVNAAGVTFAGSMLERVIEERAKGEPERAEAIRRELAPVVGESLRGVEPGSEKAAKVKALPEGAYRTMGQLALAKSQVTAGQRDAAIETLRQIRTEDPALAPVVQLRLARLLVDAKKAEEALKLLGTADSVAAMEVRGDAQMALGQRDQARDTYNKALVKAAEGTLQRFLLELKLTEAGGTPPKSEAKS